MYSLKLSSRFIYKGFLLRYTEYLRANKPSQVLPYQTAMGETEALVNYHLSNGTYSDALMAAVVGFQGSKSFSSERHSADGKYKPVVCQGFRFSLSRYRLTSGRIYLHLIYEYDN